MPNGHRVPGKQNLRSVAVTIAQVQSIQHAQEKSLKSVTPLAGLVLASERLSLPASAHR